MLVRDGLVQVAATQNTAFPQPWATRPCREEQAEDRGLIAVRVGTLVVASKVTLVC